MSNRKKSNAATSVSAGNQGFWGLFNKGGNKPGNTPERKPPPVVKRGSTPLASRNSKVDVEDTTLVDAKNESFAWKPDKKKPVKRKRLSVKVDNYDTLPICGISVRLPEGLKPYPTQKLIMVRILTALKNRLNVLAESPTGSGKTMALLASTCAWLNNYYQQRREARENCSVHGYGIKTETTFSEVNEAATLDEKGTITQSKGVLEHEWEDDFTLVNDDDNSSKPSLLEDESSLLPDPKCSCLPRVRIYYGTRTHKQISQVVGEFSRLPYAGTIRHTILASREQSCINVAARNSPDISNFCKEINGQDGIGCTVKVNMRQRFEKATSLRSFIERNGETVFDMEELVETLSTSNPPLCPYFCSTRVLTQDADIIFCPFTYLVDPLIRDSSDVHIKNSIVILDEAHNIEDTCREAASFVFTEKELDDSLHSLRSKMTEIDNELSEARFIMDPNDPKSIERLETYKELKENLSTLERLINEMVRWLRVLSTTAINKPVGRDGKQTSTLFWANLYDSMTNVEQGIDLFMPPTSPKYAAIKACFASCAAKGEGEQQWTDNFRPSATAIVTVEKWIYFQEWFGVEEYRTTYRVNVSIEQVKPKYGGDVFGEPALRNRGAGPRNMKYRDDDDASWMDDSSNDGWLDSTTGKSGYKPVAAGCKTSVSLWCMSPSLAFRGAFSDARSVILASGTLCPMDTLKTELGVEFKAQMEGDQVIPSERIFAAVLPAGPFGNRIQATYKNTSNEDSSFYAEVGAIIKHVCMSVPAGVLCFLPSYRLLEQLKSHMEKCSWMRQIELKKVVLFEPRRSSELGEVMDKFEEAIEQPKNFGARVDGALMFAVFRGKISEGIDFADDRARVVISIGIPFPNSVDELVSAKRKYNDENSKTLGILNGEEWYITQAYRALNQALGRCLRHKNDWGALILIDERLERQTAAKQIGPSSARVSKWIRNNLRVYPHFGSFAQDLLAFFERMQPSIEQPQVKTEPPVFI